MECDRRTKLFLICLGGSRINCHTEMHDIRWVAANNIEETFPSLRKEWQGRLKGLHIDSYMEIKYIDGYKVSIEKDLSSNKIHQQKGSKFKINKRKQLWFIELGGYSPNEFKEAHRYHLSVACSAKEAKEKAIISWDKNYLSIHKDNSICISNSLISDNCHEIRNIGKWHVLLTEDKLKRSQKIQPDWYGYKRID